MKESTKIFLKKYIPFIGLASLTILLMIFFKINSNKGAKIFEEGKVILADFYVQNLKPLFYDSEITRDDIFEFAVNNQIPIDKEDKKSLQIGTDDSGEEYFQIISTPEAKNENNYYAFKKILNLNESQQKLLDSLLDSYREDLYSAVLVNDDNTYAINSELHLIQKAIAYDLYEFTYSLKPGSSFSSSVKADQVKLDNFVYSFRKNDTNNFIVFAQDTILETSLVFDKLKLENDIEKLHFDKQKLKDQIAKNNFTVAVVKDELNKLSAGISQKSVVVRKDKKNDKVIVVNNGKINLGIPNIDLSSLSDLPKNIELLSNMHINLTTDSVNNQLSLSLTTNDEKSKAINFVIGLDEREIEKAIEESVKNINWENINEWEEFGLKIDSLASSFEFEIQDSSFKIKINNKSSQNRTKVK